MRPLDFLSDYDRNLPELPLQLETCYDETVLFSCCVGPVSFLLCLLRRISFSNSDEVAMSSLGSLNTFTRSVWEFDPSGWPDLCYFQDTCQSQLSASNSWKLVFLLDIQLEFPQNLLKVKWTYYKLGYRYFCSEWMSLDKELWSSSFSSFN